MCCWLLISILLFMGLFLGCVSISLFVLATFSVKHVVFDLGIAWFADFLELNDLLVVRRHSILHKLISLLHPFAFVSVHMSTYAFASVLYVSLFADAEVSLYGGELIWYRRLLIGRTSSAIGFGDLREDKKIFGVKDKERRQACKLGFIHCSHSVNSWFWS